MKSRHIAVIAVRLFALYLIVLNLCDILGTVLLNAFRNDGMYNALPTISMLTFAIGVVLWLVAPWLARNTIKDTEEEVVKIDMAQFVACAIAGIFLWVLASNFGNVVYYVAHQFNGDSKGPELGSMYGLSRDPYQVLTTFILAFLLVLLAPRLGIAFENSFSDVRKQNNG